MSSDLNQLSILRERTSTKWRKYDQEILPMHIAEMDFEIADEIKNDLIKRVTKSDLGYLGSIPELSMALRDFASIRWNWEINPELVSHATDVGVAAVEILRLIANPNDQVLINTPVYANFFAWIPEVGMKICDVPLLESSTGWSLDLEGIESAFRSGVKTYLLCNPHNPVGRVHSRAELTSIAELSKEYGVNVISDEIHAPLTFTDAQFTPYLSIPAATEYGYAITSASKAWNLAGLKAAVLVAGSNSAYSKISAMPVAVQSRTSLLGAFAMTTAYRHGVRWLDETITKLDENRWLVRDLLTQYLPGVGYRVPQSSYLAWLDLSNYGNNDSWHDFLVRHAQVAIVPGQDYGPRHTNYVRFNFGTYPEIIFDGISRIAKVLH